MGSGPRADSAVGRGDGSTHRTGSTTNAAAPPHASSTSSPAARSFKAELGGGAGPAASWPRPAAHWPRPAASAPTRSCPLCASESTASPCRAPLPHRSARSQGRSLIGPARGPAARALLPHGLRVPARSDAAPRPAPALKTPCSYGGGSWVASAVADQEFPLTAQVSAGKRRWTRRPRGAAASCDLREEGSGRRPALVTSAPFR